MSEPKPSKKVRVWSKGQITIPASETKFNPK